MSESPVVLSDVNGWGITGIVIGILVVIAILFNIKDIARYIKISSM